jgi:hypothetical protein
VGLALLAVTLLGLLREDADVEVDELVVGDRPDDGRRQGPLRRSVAEVLSDLHGDREADTTAFRSWRKPARALA